METTVDQRDLERQLSELDRALRHARDLVGSLSTMRHEVWGELMDARMKANDSTPPERDRYVSPLGDRRERPVPCSSCSHPTMALDLLCDGCWAVLGAKAQAGGAA